MSSAVTETMDKMWAALEAYQPYAEKHGFGETWLRMTTERTKEAADATEAAASDKVGFSCMVAVAAAWAGSVVDRADSYFPEETPLEAIIVITLITRAIEQESKETA